MHEGTLSVARISGHPIHPMLVPFPIAFLCAVPLTDIAHCRTGSPFWQRASWWLLAAGLATAVPATVAGAFDFWGRKKVREHRAGWLHFMGNVAAVSITAANLSLRQKNWNKGPCQWGLPLSTATFGLLVITGWYGGELSYRHRIGVIPESS